LDSNENDEQKEGRNVSNRKFKFVELFAGIGGFRLSLEALGKNLTCIFYVVILCSYYFWF
jgi:hypothetical protein